MMPALSASECCSPSSFLPTAAKRSSWVFTSGKENDASYSNTKEISSSQRNREVDFLSIENLEIWVELCLLQRSHPSVSNLAVQKEKQRRKLPFLWSSQEWHNLYLHTGEWGWKQTYSPGLLRRTLDFPAASLQETVLPSFFYLTFTSLLLSSGSSVTQELGRDSWFC